MLKLKSSMFKGIEKLEEKQCEETVCGTLIDRHDPLVNLPNSCSVGLYLGPTLDLP